MSLVGPGIAYYENRSDGEVVVHAAMPVNVEETADEDISIVDLPAVERAATIVHRGSMDEVMTSLQTMAGWIDSNGERAVGPSREVYLVVDADHANWVTELQEPLHGRR